MQKILERPDFVRTDDMRSDLRRAHRISEILETERLRSVELESNRVAVKKARRAAPVRSTGGVHAAATGHSGSLDSSISAALAHLPDD
jgi:hypothetical protein